MSAESGNAPAWLFAFVDLAFLSLMAMTQITSDQIPGPDLGELVVPHVGSEVVSDLAAGSTDQWQLRVYPLDSEDANPFELVHPVGETAGDGPRRLDISELRERLQSLRASRERKPLLAPHGDSRSQDMLGAAALIEEMWPTRRRALVARQLLRREP